MKEETEETPKQKEKDGAPIPDGFVKVKANRWICEDGKTHAKGEEFAVRASRVPALGKQVTVIK
jgi:hypothetical protein